MRIACGREGSLWRDGCRSLAPLAVERCYLCHRLLAGGRTCKSCRHKSPLHAVQAATRYEAKQLVWKLTFERARAGFKPVAEIMVKRLALPAEAVIAPIPTSTSRIRLWDYDQTVLIARHFAWLTGVSYASPLMRLGQQQQDTATRQQRLKQLQSAFAVSRSQEVRG